MLVNYTTVPLPKKVPLDPKGVLTDVYPRVNILKHVEKPAMVDLFGRSSTFMVDFQHPTLTLQEGTRDGGCQQEFQSE